MQELIQTVLRKSGVSMRIAGAARKLLALATVAIGLQAVPALAQTVYFHNDAAGSPVAATDTSGNLLWKESYRPYGERMLKPAAANTQWFHGKQLDPDTGLEDFGARNYDPVLGRFLSIDPVDFQDKNIHTFNRYAYGANNPLKYKDPDGRQYVSVNVYPQFEPMQYLKDFAWEAAKFIGMASMGEGIVLKGMAGAGEIAPILNLGSGANPMAGAVNVSLRAEQGVNVVADAKALPFANRTFGEAHAINPYGFNPVSRETARVLQPNSKLYVTGTARNSFAQPLSDLEAEAAGFRVLESGPITKAHQFGVQRATTGAELKNTEMSTTTVYQVLP